MIFNLRTMKTLLLLIRTSKHSGLLFNSILVGLANLTLHINNSLTYYWFYLKAFPSSSLV